MLIPVQDFFITTQKTSTFKLFLKEKEAGTITIDHLYVPAKKPEPPKVVPAKEKKVDRPKASVLPDLPKT